MLSRRKLGRITGRLELMTRMMTKAERKHWDMMLTRIVRGKIFKKREGNEGWYDEKENAEISVIQMARKTREKNEEAENKTS